MQVCLALADQFLDGETVPKSKGCPRFIDILEVLRKAQAHNLKELIKVMALRPLFIRRSRRSILAIVASEPDCREHYSWADGPFDMYGRTVPDASHHIFLL